MVRSSSSSSDRRTSVNDHETQVSRILNQKIEYIASDEFEAMLAAKTKTQKFQIETPKRAPRRRASIEGEQTSCLSSALSEPLLSFAEEQFEFRRMNYLKFVAARIQSSINPRRPSLSKLAEIERLLAESVEVRDHIIRSNLRLVVSNAGKYRSPHYGFEDLVSDGSLALMEAVDKFDYQRGFRFSTYATHAIRRSFFRKIERRQRDRSRFVATDPTVLISTPDTFEQLDIGVTAQSRLIGRVVESLSEHLSERERHIVEGRFGLNGRSEPRTLMELSSELGICKERVRQVEGLALRKLQSVAIGYTHSDSDLAEAAPA